MVPLSEYTYIEMAGLYTLWLIQANVIIVYCSITMGGTVWLVKSDYRLCNRLCLHYPNCTTASFMAQLISQLNIIVQKTWLYFLFFHLEKNFCTLCYGTLLGPNKQIINLLRYTFYGLSDTVSFDQFIYINCRRYPPHL